MTDGAPFVVVRDPSGIFWRGLQFKRQQVGMTLWMACWPPGLELRDTADNTRYRVVDAGGRYRDCPHQALESFGGTTRLVAPSDNGNLRRVEIAP